MQKGVYFISGIDTEIGKTITTGILAKQLLQQDIRVITQKLVQTGNTDFSEDIAKHRQIMQVELFAEDKQGLTAPQIFHYPASPHLATALQNCQLNLSSIQQATLQLQNNYDVILLEGAGGLMVPLTQDLLTIDYIAQQNYPVILVTSGRLGSINHTLLSLLALQQYNIELYAIAFNAFHDHADQLIAQDTRQYLQSYLAHHFPKAQWIEINSIANN